MLACADVGSDEKLVTMGVLEKTSTQMRLGFLEKQAVGQAGPDSALVQNRAVDLGPRADGREEGRGDAGPVSS